MNITNEEHQTLTQKVTVLNPALRMVLRQSIPDKTVYTILVLSKALEENPDLTLRDLAKIETILEARLAGYK